MPPQAEPSYVFDNFDIDLVVKVLSHTAFSKSLRQLMKQVIEHYCFIGPFFTFFIPLFYISGGAKITDGVVVYSAAHCVAVSLFCESNGGLDR
jgi:hypothetical protein